jgi:hypothetical protein
MLWGLLGDYFFARLKVRTAARLHSATTEELRAKTLGRGV